MLRSIRARAGRCDNHEESNRFVEQVWSKSLAEADLWKTSHDVVAEAYAEAGYDVPEIVYWDM